MFTAASAIDAPFLNNSLLNELVAIPPIAAAAAPFFTSPLVTTVVMMPKTCRVIRTVPRRNKVSHAVTIEMVNARVETTTLIAGGHA
jgi:hypothetical protein